MGTQSVQMIIWTLSNAKKSDLEITLII